MSVAEFVEYLEETTTWSLRPLTEWQKTVFDAFEPLTSKTRTAFLGVCKQSIRDGKRKLEALIEIANTLHDKDAETIESVRDTLKKLSATDNVKR